MVQESTPFGLTPKMLPGLWNPLEPLAPDGRRQKSEVRGQKKKQGDANYLSSVLATIGSRAKIDNDGF